jgi:hypothetical protein
MAEICVSRGTARGLANRWFQPLTHVSGGCFPRFSGAYVNRGKRETRHSKRFAVAHRTAHSVRIDMCKFRARSVLEAGDRIDVFDLAEMDYEDDGGKLDLTRVLDGVDLKAATPEQKGRIIAASDIAEKRLDNLNRKIERGGHMIDFLGAAHRIIGMCVLTLDLINTPGLVGLRQHDPHRGFARRLAAYRSGSYPLRGWSEIVLKHQTRIAEEAEHHTGATFHKCLHFVRSHLRHYRDGKVTVIPAHWRGDPALGIKRTRYRLAA